MNELYRKLVFVTGAGSGIGYEVCMAFAREGSRIIATDISDQGLAKVAADVSALGRDISTYRLDVSNAEEYASVAKEVLGEQGCPDILVNNAGIAIFENFSDTSYAMWNKTLQINILGVVNGISAFVEPMKASKSRCHIVNLSSLAAKMPTPAMSAYAASKYAVEGLSDALRSEFLIEAPNIKVTCVHPGLIKTNIIPTEGSSFTKEEYAKLQAKYDEEGSHPRVVAQDITEAVRQDEPMLLTGAQARIGFWLSKFLPKRMMARVTADQARKMKEVI